MLDLAVAILVVIRTQAEAVDVLGKLDQQPHVDPGIHIDVLGIPQFRIGEVLAVKHGLEFVDIRLQPILLCRRDVARLAFEAAGRISRLDESLFLEFAAW